MRIDLPAAARRTAVQSIRPDERDNRADDERVGHRCAEAATRAETRTRRDSEHQNQSRPAAGDEKAPQEPMVDPSQQDRRRQQAMARVMIRKRKSAPA